MMDAIKTRSYKKIKIEYYVTNDGKFYCSSIPTGAVWKMINQTGHQWDTMSEAENAIHDEIDSFLKRTPKNYKELAEAIPLTWTGYEDCYIDPQALEIIVTNFLKYQSSKGNDEQL